MDKALNDKSYYANTAYDSRKDCQRIETSENRWTPNRMNGHLLKWGVDFSGFMAVSDYTPEKFNKYKKTFDDLNYEKRSPYHGLKDSRKDDGKGNGLNHDHMVVLSPQSWAMVVGFIFIASRIALILMSVIVVVDSFIRKDWSALRDVGVYMLLGGILGVFGFSWLALKKNWVNFKMRAILFRSTGLVYVFPHKGGDAEIHPFTEFDGFINSSAAGSRAGVLTYTLEITHRQHRGLRVPIGFESYNKSEIFMKWEMIQQFMDVSKPLPDVPELEPFRHLDPVTAEWDKQHNRPPDLYEKMSDQTFSKYRNKLVWNYEKGFRWGSDRWVSDSEGWRAPPEEWWLVSVDDTEIPAA